MAKIKIDQPITVDHIARIEGKAGIEVLLNNDDTVEVKVNVFEGPRFFEKITVGKPVEEAVSIFPRVCSFCASAHKITALQAAEDAIGIKSTKQVQNLRELMYLGDHIESHALHLFLLALPDFLGYPDAFSMAKKYPHVMKTALNLKDVGAHIQTVIGSRYIHQENAILGGFGTMNFKKNLINLDRVISKSTKEAELAHTLFAQYRLWPEITSERVHIAIKPDTDDYTIIGSHIHTSEGTQFSQKEYRKYIQESVVPHSFAKHCTFKGKPFTTGALSRIVLNGHLLSGRSKKCLDEHKELIHAHNPLSNNIAQAIEIICFIDKAKELIAEILSDFNPSEKPEQYNYAQAKTGYSVTEAPRGLVAYMLEVGKDGLIKAADVITPTAMFLPQKERDLLIMTSSMLEKGVCEPKEIQKKLETIVRSYDPCISCSVHVTRAKKL